MCVVKESQKSFLIHVFYFLLGLSQSARCVFHGSLLPPMETGATLPPPFGMAQTLSVLPKDPVPSQ